ncbi:hypothetical protein D918_09554 [Trichuris suis]|nr:hypothetical protein D918_09554 [Trichuris suis]
MKRFSNILVMKIPGWVVDPFCNLEKETKLQEELVEPRNNEELKLKLKSGYHQFWLRQQIARLQPRIWAVVEKLLTAFPSLCLVE